MYDFCGISRLFLRQMRHQTPASKPAATPEKTMLVPAASPRDLPIVFAQNRPRIASMLSDTTVGSGQSSSNDFAPRAATARKLACIMGPQKHEADAQRVAPKPEARGIIAEARRMHRPHFRARPGQTGQAKWPLPAAALANSIGLTSADALPKTARPGQSATKARALPMPVVVRTEQPSGVQHYSAYMPCTGQTIYTEHAVIDGQRYGRMGSEALVPAPSDADMLSLADAAACLSAAPSATAAAEAARQYASRVMRERAYAIIQQDFPEAYDKATIREAGQVQVYVPAKQRDSSRSRDRRRARYYTKQLPPPLPALDVEQHRGRSTQARARCTTPTFLARQASQTVPMTTIFKRHLGRVLHGSLRPWQASHKINKR